MIKSQQITTPTQTWTQSNMAHIEITILCLATPSDIDELRCLTCGMEWKGGSSDSASRHVNEHHLNLDVEHIRWRDRHKYFPKYPHNPKPCAVCGLETISAESGETRQCVCEDNVKRREAARLQCASCTTEKDMAESGVFLSDGSPYLIPAGLHTCGMVTNDS